MSKGFSLVELLTVLAVLSVVAGIILVAVNPLEQIRRGRDANAKQQVSHVGNAATIYYTGRGGGGGASFPTTAEGQAVMVAEGSLKAPIDTVTYKGLPDGTAFVAFAEMQSKNSKANTENIKPCENPSLTAYFVYRQRASGEANAQLWCGSSEPEP